MTETLLIVGVAAAVVFVAVLLIEGAVRPGYDPTYHTGSELELGERGWIQRANFFLMGGGVFAFAVGVQQTLDSISGAVLLAIFGFGLIVAGAFAPDPIRGYPPGGACLTLAGGLDGSWRMYTVLTAIVGLALTVWTALAFQRDAANTGLVQRALILVYWSWIVLLGLHLV